MESAWSGETARRLCYYVSSSLWREPFPYRASCLVSSKYHIYVHFNQSSTVRLREQYTPSDVDSVPVWKVQQDVRHRFGEVLSDKEIGLIVFTAFPQCTRRKKKGQSREYYYVGFKPAVHQHFVQQLAPTEVSTSVPTTPG